MDPIGLDRLERVRRVATVPTTSRDEAWFREVEAAFWPAPIVAEFPTDGHSDGQCSKLAWARATASCAGGRRVLIPSTSSPVREEASPTWS